MAVVFGALASIRCTESSKNRHSQKASSKKATSTEDNTDWWSAEAARRWPWLGDIAEIAGGEGWIGKIKLCSHESAIKKVLGAPSRITEVENANWGLRKHYAYLDHDNPGFPLVSVTVSRRTRRVTEIWHYGNWRTRRGAKRGMTQDNLDRLYGKGTCKLDSIIMFKRYVCQSEGLMFEVDEGPEKASSKVSFEGVMVGHPCEGDATGTGKK
jgi:hypothetical protein